MDCWISFAFLIVYFSEEVIWERISPFESKNAQKMLKCSKNREICFLLKFARKMLEHYSLLSLPAALCLS
jgi:hypothetical protein